MESPTCQQESLSLPARFCEEAGKIGMPGFPNRNIWFWYIAAFTGSDTALNHFATILSHFATVLSHFVTILSHFAMMLSHFFVFRQLFCDFRQSVLSHFVIFSDIL
jgi:hypothetical protein